MVVTRWTTGVNDMATFIENIERDGFTFRVEHEYDHDAGAPWDREDGHGNVRYVGNHGYTGKPEKTPGELVLMGDRHGAQVYDFADACEQARKDNWGSYGWQGAGEGMTRRQFAAEQARNDYDRLRAWCKEEWYYLGVVVTLMCVDGSETDAVQSLWGIESDAGTYLGQTASELVNGCITDITNRLEFDESQTWYRSGARSWVVSKEAKQ